MEKYKTTGEVEKVTGINERKIKSYRERKLIFPKMQKNGRKNLYLYDNLDVYIIQQINLYEELGYSNEKIKKVVYLNEKFNAIKNLDNHIENLRSEKRHLENLLCAAEHMRLYNMLDREYGEYDIEDFDGDIDTYFEDVFTKEAERKTEDGLFDLIGEILNKSDLEKYERAGDGIIKFVKEVTNLLKNDDEKEQKQIKFNKIANNLKKKLSLIQDNDEIIGPEHIMYIYRILGTISMDRLLDMMVEKKGAFSNLEMLLNEYLINDKSDRGETKNDGKNE